MLTLKNWYLKETMEGPLYANGEVYGHYRLHDGMHIHTSCIVNFYDLGEGEYVLETYSGSLYQVKESEISSDALEETKCFLAEAGWKEADGIRERINIAEAEFTRMREVRENALNSAERWAEESLGNEELYLIMESMRVRKALYKHEDRVYEIKSKVHVGMFQDSVMVTDWENGNVDFRFFPNYQMEPYHWSDGLEKLQIHNITVKDFEFKGTNANVVCKAGEITVIDKSAYRGEGLFSPDAVSGKCVFFSGKTSEEDDNN